jgi:hypothetical protein
MGFTPLTEALQQAREALAGASLAGSTTVVVVTDGEPNCAWDAAAAQQIMRDWRSAGIETLVIGLPGTGEGAASVLDELAEAGGNAPFLLGDSFTLQVKLSEILEGDQRAVQSCVITLDESVNASQLHLLVSLSGRIHQVPRDLGDGAGWSLDGSVVELTGQLCAAAQEGRFQQLFFELGCVSAAVLPGL